MSCKREEAVISHPEPVRESGARNVCRLFLPCCVALLLAGLASPAWAAGSATPRVKGDAAVWKKNRDAGQKAAEKGDFQQAAVFFRAALGEAENFDAKDYRLAESLRNLGCLNFALGDSAAAEPLFRRALAIRRANSDSRATAECLFDLGINCESLARYDEAEKSLTEALEIVAKVESSVHPFAVLCRFELARCYLALHDDARAEPLLKQTVELFRHPASQVTRQSTEPALYGSRLVRWTYEPDYFHARAGLTLLGLLCVRQNRPAEAEPYFKDALKLAEEQLAKDSPALQSLLESLVSLQIARTNYPAAEDTLKHAIKFQEKSASAKTPPSFRPHAQLIALYEKQHKTADEEALYRALLASQDKTLGADSSESDETARAFAKFYFAQDRYAEAEPLCRRQRIRAEKNQGGGVLLAPILADQEILYSKLGRDTELEAVYLRQIELYGKLFGPNHKAVLKPLENYAALLRKEKRDNEAQPLESRSRAIRDAQPK